MRRAMCITSDDAPLGQLTRHIQVVRAATDGFTSDAAQRSGSEYLVVGHRHVVGHGLVGALSLELGDVRADDRLLVLAHTPPKVTD